MSDGELLQRRFNREHAARLAAESLLESKAIELYESNRQLHGMAQQYHAIFESAAEGIVCYDHLGIIVSVNRSARHIFRSEDLVGSALGQWFDPACDFQSVIFPPRVFAWEAADSVDDRCPADTPNPQSIEVRCQRSSGEIFTAEIAASRLDTSDASHFTILIRDLTKRQLLEARLRQAQKMESIGQLAAGIAHEINTPIQYVGDNTRFVQEACDDLTEVLLACQHLIQVADSGEDVQLATQNLKARFESTEVDYLIEEVPAAIRQTLDGVERVSNIVRAMKEFAHPGSSEMTLIDISHSISNTLMVARNEWKYVADVETEFDPSLGPVPCLPGELNQVLLNIIVNAAHAIGESLGSAREGKGKGKIRITTHLHPPFAVIRIADTGIGIPTDQIPKIFNHFYTTKAIGKGTGQGLAIAHAVIVEKHSGSIAVESEVGVGTTFVLSIPLKRERELPASPKLFTELLS